MKKRWRARARSARSHRIRRHHARQKRNRSGAFVRGQAALANTPVLLISGIVNDEVTKQAESCHADGVLGKPFQGTSLKDRVLELGKKQSATSPAPAKAAATSAAPTAPANAQVLDEQGLRRAGD